MRNTAIPVQGGTLIQGTLRLSDLIPAFMDAVRDHAPVEYGGLVLSNPVPAYVYDEGDDSEWWGSEWWGSEEAHRLLDELMDILDAAGPEGTYFGAHPGNGSDFGWWSEEEEPSHE